VRPAQAVDSGSIVSAIAKRLSKLDASRSGTMKISGIDHVQLAIPPGGEDLARAFYGHLLDLVEKPKPPDLARRGGVWFENDVVKIHLGIDPNFHSARKAHPALLVRDLDGLIERFLREGIEVDAGDRAGYHRVYVSDPFGNRIELIDADPER
jgi:catechol 2,3-dioxygenase-like lactoylglutathione lyase family enzyme